MNLEEILYEKFGYTQFRSGQKEVIEAALNRNDVLAILPTGTGKTLCYQFPSMLQEGMTIVVSPLLSLMEDQVHQLRAYGDKRVVQLNSLLSFKERRTTLHNLTNHSMVFTSPEMLSNEYVISALVKYDIGLFVVDEAHCISQWGHEFRTDYLRLMLVRERLGNPPCLALTATATKSVEADIIKRLGMEKPAVLRYPVNRNEIGLVTDRVKNKDEKDEQLIRWLKNLKKPGIIYVGTRNEAERLQCLMHNNHFTNTSYYHAGLTKEDRLLVQNQFINDELDWIVATNAFGMGINKSNIRSIIHMYLPPSFEQYVQEIGRAGRDGNHSTAVCIFSKEDRNLPINFIQREFPAKQEFEGWFYTGKGSYLTEQLKVKPNEIKELFQIDETIWRMVLFYLEEESILVDGEIIVNNITNSSIQRIIEHFMNRANEKLERFLKFEQYIFSRSCLRKGLLHYFNDHNVKVEEKKCCSNCHDMKVFIDENEEEIRHNRQSVVNNSYALWEKELAQIFNRSMSVK
ncbi:RecQ family ATP-dependent DNA helicase [Evansella halocellulosilytica]|uniref:RecQ family ATP-dependent DNA helicase n=1 Tax=Evansella halocellulosilytica TaxID=2011013 RepID=UPI0015C89C1D|nr:RecQ family ATP-dependent DNA helicase [Evansella halocellulosilytica]